ncbi:MAG: PadR family transcriptional regulator [Intrasporangium sp.]|uniref:PadR family transcriptional regulator n=1 Tax=Intrasporangium sp. TaxID=1925024 RepID=UPI00264731F3|nr:PadR family transcriptional regulator [Intrasporangium sp.]MDN5797573.1 PadR family transcriptional regulator [Intrasporangium sp.]
MSGPNEGEGRWGAGWGGRGGGGPWSGGAWGGGPPWGPPGWGGGHRHGPPPWIRDVIRSFGGPDIAPARRAKVRRGDVRSAILAVLAQEPMNGYQVIQQIAERTGGAWKPSPGSVYPTIQQLEDEGLIMGVDEAGRRVLRLTDAGRQYVDAHEDELSETWEPFETGGQRSERSQPMGGEFERVIGQVIGAVWQVMVSGTQQQRAEAADILAETRRRLYGLLADEDDDRPDTSDDTDS